MHRKRLDSISRSLHPSYECLLTSLSGACYFSTSKEAPYSNKGDPTKSGVRNPQIKPLPLDGDLSGVLRSVLMLVSSDLASGCCSVHNLTGAINGWTLAAALLLAGVGVVTEKKSRRMELALYVLSRATESFSHCLVDWGYLTPVKWRSDVLLFSLASAFITHCYSDDEDAHRHSFRSKYLNVLDFVFGNSGIHSGEVHHVPSNQDLFLMGSNWWSNGWFRKLMNWSWF